ncbi:MAG: hypothetical protein LBU53_07430 [Zoogloeaceae bacterium]|jgi:hypothetical protein|nr:hypothetical protein [Zoogloeaceae bacterium]
MSLETGITALAQAIGADMKALSARRSVYLRLDESTTFISPTDHFKIWLFGAGGSGAVALVLICAASASAPSPAGRAAATGGAAGGTSIKDVRCNVGDPFTLLLGAPGAGVTALVSSNRAGTYTSSETGNAGGASSFAGAGVSLLAEGGEGGKAAASSATTTALATAASVGGAASGGDENYTGGGCVPVYIPATPTGAQAVSFAGGSSGLYADGLTSAAPTLTPHPVQCDFLNLLARRVSANYPLTATTFGAYEASVLPGEVVALQQTYANGSSQTLEAIDVVGAFQGSIPGTPCSSGTRQYFYLPDQTPFIGGGGAGLTSLDGASVVNSAYARAQATGAKGGAACAIIEVIYD